MVPEEVEQQEKKISLLEISKKGGTEALMKEVELLKKKESSCQKGKGRLEESNTDQKLKLETTQHNLIVLREECAELRKVAGALRIDATDATMVDRLHRSVRSYIIHTYSHLEHIKLLGPSSHVHFSSHLSHSSYSGQ